MSHTIIGVRYVGRKAPYRDNVMNSGAIWEAPGDVINFSSALAALLTTRHRDIFEEAPVDYSAQVVLSVPNMPRPKPIAIMSFASANKTQIVNFMRMHYGRVLSEQDSIETLRMQAIHAIQAQAVVHEPQLERFMVPYAMTAEEYSALTAGDVVLRLVPVARPYAVDEDETAVGEGVPVLEDLLATLDAEKLREFAEQNQVPISARWGENRLRTEIAKYLREHAATTETGTAPVAATTDEGGGEQPAEVGGEETPQANVEESAPTEPVVDVTQPAGDAA